MPSTWGKAAKAIFKKEAKVELRSCHGLVTSFLFGLMSVASIAFVLGFGIPNEGLSAGLLCIILLFSLTLAIPRIFITEEELKTMDLLRLWAPASATYFGKTLFASLFAIIQSVILGVLYLAVINLPISMPWVFIIGLPLFGWATAGALSLTSSLVIHSSNRWILAGVVGLPLLFPLIFLGVGLFRTGLGIGSNLTAFTNLIALVLYGVSSLALGPSLADYVWSERSDPAKPLPTIQTERSDK